MVHRCGNDFLWLSGWAPQAAGAEHLHSSRLLVLAQLGQNRLGSDDGEEDDKEEDIKTKLSGK